MDWDFYTKLIDEMAELGIKEAGMFFLGESMLVKWLPKAIKYAKDAGIEYVFLTTNGKAATKERIKACMEAGLDSLKFSYNNADPEQFEEIVGIAGKFFDQVNQNIKDAWEVREEGGYKCGLFASSIRYDDEQAEKMQAAVDKIMPYLDEFYYLPLYSQAGLVGEDMEALGKKPVKGNFGRWGVDRDENQNHCFALFTEARVTYDGRMSGCCFNHTHEFDMGDLNKLTFMHCWQSQKYQNLRQAMLDGDMTGTPCEECWTCTYV
jgi:radical SAM protein with 4Fe4S-binding SPASM domain